MRMPGYQRCQPAVDPLNSVHKVTAFLQQKMLKRKKLNRLNAFTSGYPINSASGEYATPPGFSGFFEFTEL
ncbi:MAG: hypothetical protein DWQ05_21330 [Calditrichaeota bacterium]|nr:MAG: hypothetical protein DWQ05_21330 [Calditrichota bacterium]